MKPPIHHASDYLAIKTAFRLLVHRCGGLSAAEAATRVGTSQLADYYHPHKLNCMPAADVVADLEAVVQAPLVTAELARIAGHQLVPLTPADGTQLAAAIAASTREGAEVPVAFLEATTDGSIGPDEAGRVEREALQAAGCFTRVALVAGAIARPGDVSLHPSPSAAPAVKDGGASADHGCPNNGGGRPHLPESAR